MLRRAATATAMSVRVALRPCIGSISVGGRLLGVLSPADLEDARVNHVEALRGLEAGDDLALEGLHAGAVALAPGEVEVELPAQQTVGDSGEAVERVLDAVAEELSTKHVVVQ